jgi:hypothetical protein
VSDPTSIFDLRSVLGAQIREASGADMYDPASVDLHPNMIVIRLRLADAVRLSAHFDNADRWRNAFEALHARLLRDLPGDASELPPPEDEYWARTLDDLLTFAAETARAAEKQGG